MAKTAKTAKIKFQAGAEFWRDPLNRPWPKAELRKALALLEKFDLVPNVAGVRQQISAGGCRCDDVPFGDGTPWCPAHDDGRMGKPPRRGGSKKS